jgi:hypothetical protein
MVQIRGAGGAGVVVLLACTLLGFGAQPGAQDNPKADTPPATKDSPKTDTHQTKSNFITQTYDLPVRDHSRSEAFQGIPNFLGHVYVRVTDAGNQGLLNRKAVYAVGADSQAHITQEADGFVKKVGDNGGIGDMTLDDAGRRDRYWRVINIPGDIYKIRVTVAGIQD